MQVAWVPVLGSKFFHIGEFGMFELLARFPISLRVTISREGELAQAACSAQEVSCAVS